MSPLLLQLLLVSILVIIQKGATETDAELAAALMKKISSNSIRKQLEKHVPDLLSCKKFIPNKDPKVNQWVVATPLKLTIDDKDRLKIDYDKKQVEQHCYSNHRIYNQLRQDICSDQCVKDINKLTTKIKASDTVIGKTQIHTEIQVMYRDRGINLMHSNKNKVILLYSYYIPCSQNQFGNGVGVFVECAGEMTNFMVRENSNTNHFIVIYETSHKGGATVEAISRLYLELGGIPIFQYNRHTKHLTKEKLMMDVPEDFFIKNPVALQFSRPFPFGGRRYTVSQLFVDCLARNHFLGQAKDDEEKKVEFTVIKYFMYHQFGGGTRKKMEDPRLDKSVFDSIYKASKKNYKTSRQHYIVEACYIFADEFDKDWVKRGSTLTEKAEKKNFFITFNGKPSTSLDKPSVSDSKYQKFCQSCIESAKKYFEILPESLKHDACKVKEDNIHVYIPQNPEYGWKNRNTNDNRSWNPSSAYSRNRYHDHRFRNIYHEDRSTGISYNMDKSRNKYKDKSKQRSRNGSRERGRHSERGRHRDKDRAREKDRPRDRGDRSRERKKKRDRHGKRDRSRTRSRSRNGDRSRERGGYSDRSTARNGHRRFK